LRNVAMPSPPRPPPAIQPRIPGIQRMINTQSGLKRNNYVVQNPAQRGMSQRKRKKIIVKKGRVRRQLDGNSVLRIKTSKPGPDICCTCSPLLLSSLGNNRGHYTMSTQLKMTQKTEKLHNSNPLHLWYKIINGKKIETISPACSPSDRPHSTKFWPKQPLP